MYYKELLLLLACGYFNPLDEISFQSYLIYYIKQHIPSCLHNELVNIIIIEESPYTAQVLQLSSLVLLYMLYWTLSAHMYPHFMLVLTLQCINHKIQPLGHCTPCLLCYCELIISLDSQFLYGCETKTSSLSSNINFKKKK